MTPGWDRGIIGFVNMPRPATAVRWAVGACVAGYGIYSGARLVTSGDVMPPIFRLMLSLAGCCVGAVILGPELVGLVALPINRMLDAIFLPSESAPPPLDYTLARHYVRQARHEEACEEYAKIIRYHPDQLPAYLEGIQAAAQVGDEEQASRFHRGAKRAVHTDEERALLEGVYAARNEPRLPALDDEQVEPSPPALDAEKTEPQGPVA